jgi:DNA-binding MarR family transcriptional regulator
MVVALFTLIGSLDRAARHSAGATTLSLLQIVAGREAIRPSEIADLQHVHPSLVTRQVQDLEDKGYVKVTADPADGRSCLVALTPAGADEMSRLREVGLDQFAACVADWPSEEVRTLTALLEKLQSSKTAGTTRAPRPGRRRWAQQERAVPRHPGEPAQTRAGVP